MSAHNGCRAGGLAGGGEGCVTARTHTRKCVLRGREGGCARYRRGAQTQAAGAQVASADPSGGSVVLVTVTLAPPAATVTDVSISQHLSVWGNEHLTRSVRLTSWAVNLGP